MTKDFKNQRKWCYEDEIGLEDFMAKLLLLFFFFCSVSLAVAIFQIPDAEGKETPQIISGPDLLISPEMAEFVQKYGHGKVFSEGDMN